MSEQRNWSPYEGLSVEARALYGRIADGEDVGDAPAAALHELTEWFLVTDEPIGHLVVLDPREASRRRLDSELQRLAESAARLAEIPDVFDDLSVAFQRSQWQAGPGSEFLGSQDLVNARIKDVVSTARVEILAAQPHGPRTREDVGIAEPRDSAALKRGVSMRSLYRGSVLDDPVTSEFAAMMSGRGLQFRTQMGPFQRVIIIDRQQAFIEDRVSPDSPPHVAWHVRDRPVVAAFVETFEETWRRSEVWHGERPVAQLPEVGVRTTRLQREILRDNALGIAQRITAERLGMSPRSLSNALVSLKELFGVMTLQELAYQWALSPDRLIKDQPSKDTVDKAA